MTKLSVEDALKNLENVLAEEKASGQPVDDSWTNDLPDDPLPEDDEDVAVTFVKKHT